MAGITETGIYAVNGRNYTDNIGNASHMSLIVMHVGFFVNQFLIFADGSKMYVRVIWGGAEPSTWKEL